MRAPLLVCALSALLLASGCNGSDRNRAEREPERPRDPTADVGTPAAPSPPAASVDADFFTLATPAAEPGQFELLTLSTLPDTVTGGDVLIGVRRLDPADQLRVWRNGEEVTARFRRIPEGEWDGPLHGMEAGDWEGLVDGLALGANLISAEARGPAGTRRAELELRNHPRTGPVIAGPHQRPFVCRTEDAGLGPALDEHCSIETRYQWFYRGADGFVELDAPYADYPADLEYTILADGSTVPLVVRVETSTINRGITRIAVLDDPHGRGPEAPFAPNWNRNVVYAFGESCGVGYHQGVNSVQDVLGTGFSVASPTATISAIGPRLREGNLIVHSTMSALGVVCNDALAAETLMMVKEHITERYGRINRLIGTGGSGAAIQQYTAANNYPGLIDAGIPMISFPDVISTAMSAHDCGVLGNYFRANRARWPASQRNAVTGHLGMSICNDWNLLFTPHMTPGSLCDGSSNWWCQYVWNAIDSFNLPFLASASCDASIPRAQIYHPSRNPGGVRCTLQDATVNLWGRDPETGFARRPVDNVGVQYGLRALNAGKLSVEAFIHLNRHVGGVDIDGNYVAERSRMEPELAHLAYLTGRITGRGALAQTPLIDLNFYLDPVPILGFHDQVRPYLLRDRLQAAGLHTTNHSIWNGYPAAGRAHRTLHQWLDQLEGGGSPHAGRAANLAATRPADAGDRCSFDAVVGYSWGEEAAVDGGGVCNRALPALASPRMVAGGPLAENNIKCQLKPVSRDDYAVELSDAEFAQLQATFPNGVCDWRQPPVGFVDRSLIWASIGSEPVERVEPRELTWRVARSRPLNTD